MLRMILLYVPVCIQVALFVVKATHNAYYCCRRHCCCCVVLFYVRVLPQCNKSRYIYCIYIYLGVISCWFLSQVFLLLLQTSCSVLYCSRGTSVMQHSQHSWKKVFLNTAVSWPWTCCYKAPGRPSYARTSHASCVQYSTAVGRIIYTAAAELKSKSASLAILGPSVVYCHHRRYLKPLPILDVAFSTRVLNQVS